MAKKVCPNCGTELDPKYMFCPECGQELEEESRADASPDSSGEASGIDETSDSLPLGGQEPEVEVVRTPRPQERRPRYRIVRLARGGGQRAEFDIPDRGAVIGRVHSDISFPDDDTVSPRHVTLRPRDDGLEMEDADSLNGVFVKIRGEFLLAEGDMFMCGDQVFRFSTKPGAFHSSDYKLYMSPQERKVVATLTHVLEGGIEGEVYPIRSFPFVIGREVGDVTFGADRFMSRKHTSISRSEAGFVLSDLGSRNGTFVCIRSKKLLRQKDLFIVGRQMLRVEAVS